MEAYRFFCTHVQAAFQAPDIRMCGGWERPRPTDLTDLGLEREQDKNSFLGIVGTGAVREMGTHFCREPVRGSSCVPRHGLTPHRRLLSPLFGSRMTQEAFRENSMKELGRLEGQLAAVRQELAALSLKQSSVADQVGLLPQRLQAVRDDVSWNHARALLNSLSSEGVSPRSPRGREPDGPAGPCWGLGTDGLASAGLLPVLFSVTWRGVLGRPSPPGLACAPSLPAPLKPATALAWAARATMSL